jgi:transcriptional regulator with XRE-family HTH domain
MSERQPSPPAKLFELLEFCGLRQRDIVTRLGVSKTLVSLWRSGQREITPDHYQALLEFAHEVFLHSVKTLVRTPNHTPDTVEEALAVFNVFIAKLHGTHAERDPTPLYKRLLISISMLHATFTHRGEPVMWDEDTLTFVESEAQRIAEAARLLHSQVIAAKAVAAFQAQTATSLHDLLKQLKESSDAETQQ